MTAELITWATREPGRPYRWLLSLADERPARVCPVHRVGLDHLGVCPGCVVVWRRAFAAADPWTWQTCLGCGFPLHPAAEVGGHTVCPSCEMELPMAAERTS